jgi:hypothetical protein
MKSKIKVYKKSRSRDYGVTLRQVERVCAKVTNEIKRERTAGILRPWRS